MKRINDFRKLLGVGANADLAELKAIYRNFMKEFHPDKFQEEEAKLEAESKSKAIIEAYHFLVSISPETHEQNKEAYTKTLTTSVIADFEFQKSVLKITFVDGSIYEYFGVPKNLYNKFLNSPTPIRFARRHIFESFPHRKSVKVAET